MKKGKKMSGSVEQYMLGNGSHCFAKAPSHPAVRPQMRQPLMSADAAIERTFLESWVTAHGFVDLADFYARSVWKDDAKFLEMDASLAGALGFVIDPQRGKAPVTDNAKTESLLLAYTDYISQLLRVVGYEEAGKYLETQFGLEQEV